MKKSAKNFLCFFMALTFIASCTTSTTFGADETTSVENSSSTQETTTKAQKTEDEAKKTLEQQRKELEGKLKLSEEKLASFEEDAKATEDYINALDEKIGYLNEELTVLDSEITQAKTKSEELQKQIEPLEEELEELQKRYDKSKKEFDKLNDSFTKTYNAYCLRLRAMYISGSDSVIVALLTSKDISQFFSRYEMIKAIAKSDTQLLEEVNSKMEKIITEQDGLNEQKSALEKKTKELNTKQSEYTSQQKKIESNQELIAQKKVTLSEDRAQSDALLAEYTEKSQLYTEYRNEDETLIESVNKEIDSLLSGLKTPEEVTTADESNTHKSSDSNKKTSENSELYVKSNAVLNLSYPVPSHHSVSQTFGHYRNGKAHTGIDYPCPKGSKVVAAQKGIVIKVKRLNYSYGYYVMIYHGTDAKGRKVVTLYAHNSSILVSTGQTVKKGEQIAKSGSTGNSTGPHCHFELILDGSKVNPKNYLS